MEELLNKLLQDLQVIGQDHEELEDSDVSEAMTDAIHNGFFKPKDGFVLPDEYGMYSEAANHAIRDALATFLNKATPMADDLGLKFKERLAAFQNLDVTCGPAQTNYNDFFRFTPPDAYDDSGIPVRGK